MAVSNTPKLAEPFKVYVSATAPDPLTTVAGYTIVGLQTGSPINRDKPESEIRWKGGSLTLYAAVRATQQIGVLRPDAGDDGQTILRNAQASGALVYFIRTSAVTGSTGEHYTGYIGGGAETDGVDGAIADSFAVAIASTITTFTVA